jgi:hypothetical protein
MIRGTRDTTTVSDKSLTKVAAIPGWLGLFFVFIFVSINCRGFALHAFLHGRCTHQENVILPITGHCSHK